MIRYIRGTVIFTEELKGLTRVVVNAGSGDCGVGYDIFMMSRHANSITENEIISLYCHYRHRDDGADVYGFRDKTELALFEKLVGVSGVGPRSALAIMSSNDVESIIEAIQDKKPDVLRAPGIGNKTAAKIVVELTGTFTAPTESKRGSVTDIPDDIVSALEGLGYRESDIKRRLRGHTFVAHDTKGQIREALSLMSGSGR